MLRDVPVRTGYLEAQGGWSSLGGAYVRGEAGYRLAEDVAAFAFAEATRLEKMAGVGLRWRFGR